MSSPRVFALPGITLTFLALFLASALGYGALWWLDFGAQGGLVSLMTDPNATEALGSFAEVTVGVLGVAITVVAIILELAANRYTPRITELFLRDPVNVGVMGFYIVLTVLTLWITTSLHGDVWPWHMVLALEVLLSAGLLLILPYFAYVFDFLSPGRIVQHLQRTGSQALTGLAGGRQRDLERGRSELLTSVEQLGDIGLSATEQRDKAIGLTALTALAELAIEAVERREQLPAAWFDIRERAAEDQDLVALHREMVELLVERRTWVQMKILRQYQAVFSDALNRNRDINHLIAILTRRVAAAALEKGDGETLDLALRYMNTYLRAAINAVDVRTTYNLFNEYRALGEALVDAGETARVLRVAEHFKFYGQLGFSKSLPFILEIAAYDLGALLEHIHKVGLESHEAVLDVLLDVDREPDDSLAQESALRGVRKAQVKLAVYYLEHGELALARRIYEDMRAELPARLGSIHEELCSIVEREYWEVSDRGVNFDYLVPAHRTHLSTFFGWFPQQRV
ncbi:MAG: DUF2254 domain-containing protein [Deltaproteobacteria bacterium]|nr:DUF2254 domain-containing protein [Deltaproteobacteria bacterium]